MALLAPCKKFLTDIEHIIENDGNASVTIGDIRGNVFVFEDGDVIFGIYYIDNNQTSFPFSDEKKLDALIERFKEGKIFTGWTEKKESITIYGYGGDIDISGRLSSYSLEDVLSRGLSFVEADGSITYYFLDTMGNIIRQQRDPKHLVITSRKSDKLGLIVLPTMTFFENSKHPDINVEENIKLRAKMEKEVEKVVIKDLSSTISAYASNF